MNVKFKIEDNNLLKDVKINVNDKRCIVCNKPFEDKNNLFGSECLKNMYDLLGVSIPSGFFRNREKYLCTKVAHINNKFFLGKKNKYIVTEKYIELKYLDKIGYSSFDDIKNKIVKDISMINLFSNHVYGLGSYDLHDVYLAYNMWNKFNKLIDETLKEIEVINNKENNNEKEVNKAMESLLNKFKFIFDTAKISNPIFYSLLYEMQYIFWKVVIVGGVLFAKEISAKLLLHSLVPYGKTIGDYIINDSDIIDKIVKEDVFINKINDAISKNGNKEVLDSEKIKGFNKSMSFDNNDLLYSLHNASIYTKGEKTIGNSWNLEIKIIDTYDFTDIKNIKEYTNSNNSKVTSVLSSTLNNFGIISQQYGVLKKFDVIIKFKMDNFVVNWR